MQNVENIDVSPTFGNTVLPAVVGSQTKYQIIYADPAWSIQTTSQVPSGRPNSRPYVAMRMVDIYDLPVKDIADKDCVLLLWATAPLIPEALFTMKAWGFEYKTIAFTWVKRNKKADSWFWGMGWWTRSNPEYCLLGVKGDPKRAALIVIFIPPLNSTPSTLNILTV